MDRLIQARSKSEDLFDGQHDRDRYYMGGFATNIAPVGLSLKQRRRHLKQISKGTQALSSPTDSYGEDNGGRQLKDLALQRAVRLLIEASEGSGHAEAQCNLGLVFEESGDFSEAIQWYVWLWGCVCG